MARIENHQHTRHIICPWCGYKDMQSWEMAWDLAEGQEGQYVNADCKECEKVFSFTIHHEIYYTTKRVL